MLTIKFRTAEDGPTFAQIRDMLMGNILEPKWLEHLESEARLHVDGIPEPIVVTFDEIQIPDEFGPAFAYMVELDVRAFTILLRETAVA